jgi:glutamate-ammonia-ligase adenylyltransferase
VAAIREVLLRPRERDRLLADVADMRQRIARERGPAAPLDVKNRRGGLIDIEFLVQTTILLHAHADPGLLIPSTAGALQAIAAAGLLAPADAEALRRALTLTSAVQSVLRTAIDGPLDRAAQPPALLAGLARAVGAPSFAALESELDTACAAAHAVFERLIPAPVPPAGGAARA